ncbi:30S ribosomal protein S8 [Criblamydia sequanensis]|uniref:Small ribosomal subunit protein uS8 n=1 Tax=Candidatus Criblamydia sequanensis CRIB-18 TaxID=1437425 RepID=A0A090CY18_9BACT|nr:30S ribosomal protein S8 [Criblamydia sequanensis]CDR33066.1 30S ribosomal protein S8 [Criblamydia sequanensis CRIB-18]
MALSDPIADFLTRVRNASSAERRYVDICWSKMKEKLAEILKEQGFVENYLVKKENDKRGTIRIFLKYDSRKPVIRGLKRVSKPGLRRYVKHEDIPNFFGGYGVAIVSTSQGVMVGNEATKRRIGGELLCMIW